MILVTGEMSGGQLHRRDEIRPSRLVGYGQNHRTEDIGGRTYSAVTQKCLRLQEEKLCKTLDYADVVRDVVIKAFSLRTELPVTGLRPAPVV